MWIFDEIAVEEKPLGIPYFREDPRSHSYVNLRKEPDKIDLLPELTDCPPLRDLVTALNDPTGPFETYGCEKWIGAWANDEFLGYGFRQGSYVDLSFVNKEACASQTPYRELIEAFRQYVMVHRVYDLMHVGFALRWTVSASVGWWTMSVWIYGIGRDEADAKRWWTEAVEYFKNFLLTKDAAIADAGESSPAASGRSAGQER